MIPAARRSRKKVPGSSLGYNICYIATRSSEITAHVAYRTFLELNGAELIADDEQ